MRGPILSFLVLLALAGGLTVVWNHGADLWHKEEALRKCPLRQEK